MWNKIFAKEYNANEWHYMKISMMFLWLVFVLFLSPVFYSQPYPRGICNWIDCSLLLSFPFRYGYLTACVLLAYFYIREQHMGITTFMLGILCTITFTLEESNGIHNRCSLFSIIFFAQSLAYGLAKLGVMQNIQKYRIQFSVQAVAGAYTLAALSKLTTSGIAWIADTPNMALQILKSFSYRYFDSGDITVLNSGTAYANWILEHALLIQVLLGISLFLELFAPISIINRRCALVYGILLLGMHLGILILMDIWMMFIAYPMLVYLINPLYLLKIVSGNIFGKSHKLFDAPQGPPSAHHT